VYTGKFGGSNGRGLAHLIDATSCLGPTANTDLNEKFTSYIRSSLTKNTWASYSSGWNCFKKFELEEKLTVVWPLSVEVARSFVVWCLSKRNLKVSTVKLYLSSLKMIHTLQGFDCINFSKDKLIEMILTGAGNVEPSLVPKTRRAMTLDLLLVLGSNIAKCNWSRVSKQVVWAACTLSFFTSARLGEILAAQTKKFDRFSTLTWENVLFLDRNEVLVYIPSTKTSTRGEFIDLFPLKDHPCCPVAALKKLAVLQNSLPGYSKANPVFTFESGTYLTTSKLNDLLKDLLKEVCPEGCAISCHSFRAALASALGACPDKFLVSEIQEWSRWRGKSFLLYCRSYRDQRRVLFSKIATVLK
jgi:hypothetical protein